MWREKIWKEVRWRSLSQEVKKRETFGFLSVFHPLIPSLMILSSTPKSWSLLSLSSLSLLHFGTSRLQFLWLSIQFLCFRMWFSTSIFFWHLFPSLNRESGCQSVCLLDYARKAWFREEVRKREEVRIREDPFPGSCRVLSSHSPSRVSLSLSLSWCPCLFFLVVFLFRTQSVLLFHSFSSSVSFWWNLPQGFSEKVSLLSLSCLCPCLQSIPPSKSLISIAYTACCFFLQADSLLPPASEPRVKKKKGHNVSVDTMKTATPGQSLGADNDQRMYAFLSFPFLFLPSSCVKSRNRKMKERSLNFSQDTVNKSSHEGNSDAVSKTKPSLRIQWKKGRFCLQPEVLVTFKLKTQISSPSSSQVNWVRVISKRDM